MEKKIKFFDTYVDSKAFQKVQRVLDSGFLSEGRLVSEFESKLSRKLGIRNLVALNSGTSALHLALKLIGIKKGDEVILPAQTFIATGLAVKYCQATPIFADIHYLNGNINIESIRTKINQRTKAIIVVHWAGYPCDLTEINKLARENEISVVEDAAHALGATYQRYPIGNISDFTCFSFQAIKHLTTGDGGGLTTPNKKILKNAKKMRWFGIDRESTTISGLGERIYCLDEVGYKYHMNDYAAALGLSNLVNLRKRLTKLKSLANKYRDSLSSLSGIKLFENKRDRTSANWLFGLHVENRNDFVAKMKEVKIPVSVVHQRIDRNIIFGGLNKDLTVQKKFDSTQIHLPLHTGLDLEDIERIVYEMKKGW